MFGISLTWTAVALLLLNIKVLPFVFHFRLYYYVIKYFYVVPKQKLKSIYEPASMYTMTPLMEMDFNLHKSNSTYFTDMDISRTKLVTRNFSRFYREYSDKEAPKLGKFQFIYTPLGSVGLVFKKEIPAYTIYNVESRVFGWTKKWLYVISVFKSKRGVHAYGLSKYVFKQHRKTIAPEELLKFEGLLNDEVIESNKKVQHLLEKNLELEEIINLIT